jgi:hypothetical protein
LLKITKNWLLVSKNSARKGFLALGSNGKTIYGPREEKSATTLTYKRFKKSLYNRYVVASLQHAEIGNMVIFV